MTPIERLDMLNLNVRLMRANQAAHVENVKGLVAKGRYPATQIGLEERDLETLKAVEWLFRRPRVREVMIAEIEART